MWKHDIEYIFNHIWTLFYIIERETEFRRPLKSRNFAFSNLREWGFILKTQKNHFHSSYGGVKMIFFRFKVTYRTCVKQKSPLWYIPPGYKSKTTIFCWITNKILGQNVNKWCVMMFSWLIDWFSHVHGDSELNKNSGWKYDGFT